MPLVLALALFVGFHSSPRLAPAASFAAQKPVKVWCANDGYAWAQFTGRYGLTEHGRAVPGSNEMWLDPDACAFLVAKLNKKPGSAFNFAVALLTLTHEAFHLRGLTDEGQTDCQAARHVPNVGARFFGLTTHAQRHSLAAQVVAVRAHEAAAYRAIC